MNTKPNPQPADRSLSANAWRLGLIALAYALTLKLTLFLPDAKGVITGLWPPGGVALAALLLNPPRRWAAILAVIFVTGLGVDLVSGRPGLACVGFMLANVLESWGCAWVLTRICGGRRVNFESVVSVLALGVGAIFVNGLTALLGAAAARLVSPAPFLDDYLDWWIADGLGILLVTPLVIVCAQSSRLVFSSDWRQRLEAAALVLVWCALAGLAFLGTTAGLPVTPRPYWILVPLVWSALRFGTKVTTVLLALLAVIAIGLTTSGRGDFSLGGGNLLERLRMVQFFLGVVVLTGLTLAAVVAERKQAEAALRRSQERYELTSRAVNDGFWDWNFLTDEDYFSPRWKGILGYQDQELANNKAVFFDLLHPEDLARVKEVTRAHLEERQPYAVEFRLRHKDGSYRWVFSRGQAIRDAADRPVRMVGATTDISERKSTEAALQASELRYRRLFESAKDGVLILDFVTGMVVDVNPFLVRLLDYSHAEFLGKKVWELGFLKDIIANEANFAELQAMEYLRYADLALEARDGRRIEVEFVSNVYRADGCKVIQCNIRDITETKKREAQNRALQKAESLERMAGAIAHHFNNQLAAVIGNLELLQSEPPRTAESAEFLSEAMGSALKATEMSRLMLTYLGQTHGLREPQNLADLCRRQLHRLQAAMPRTVSLETNLPTTGPVIKANAPLIEQLLAILLTNAWEACGNEPGTIRLSVQTVSPRDIPATSRFPVDWQPQATTYACLAVADTGSGMAAGEIEQSFDPFYSTKFTGRGLGLAVALGILRQHGGGVTVASEPGRGSTFRVYLPVTMEALSPKPVAASTAPAAPKTSPGGTVLLVEDEPPVLKMLTRALQKLGYTVLTAQDGAEAVTVFGQHQAEISFVLLDLALPKMDGWEVLAAVRELVPGIPVILTSGYDEAAALAGEHAEQPQAFLHKPYEFELLRQAIRQAVPKSAPDPE